MFSKLLIADLLFVGNVSEINVILTCKCFSHISGNEEKRFTERNSAIFLWKPENFTKTLYRVSGTVRHNRLCDLRIQHPRNEIECLTERLTFYDIQSNLLWKYLWNKCNTFKIETLSLIRSNKYFVKGKLVHQYFQKLSVSLSIVESRWLIW